MSSDMDPIRPSGQESSDKNLPEQQESRTAQAVKSVSVPGEVTDSTSSPVPEFVQSVDTTGLLCPLPILRAKKALQGLESGQVLRVFTTDKKAVKDFQAFCQQTNHALLQQDVEEDQSAWHYIRKR